MQNNTLYITKRDGNKEPFHVEKIRAAVEKAYKAAEVQGVPLDLGKTIDVAWSVQNQVIKQNGASVEEIQDLVEEALMAIEPIVAKKYILYREWRSVEREKRTGLKRTLDGVVHIEKNDVNLGNANMSAYTPAGQMMTFASEVTKDYATKYLLSPRYSQAHRNGDIHIHDLDYYPTKTTTCVQYDLGDIFERGFRTKNGSVRTPQSIQSYATLATIVFQTNQNEQHGGQSIPAFDFFMAQGVRKTFHKHLTERIDFLLASMGVTMHQDIKHIINKANPALSYDKESLSYLHKFLEAEYIGLTRADVCTCLESAYKATERDTHQAMEGFIHNLNTMHSRGGNQVVFSSVNYGTDTSPEGRMVIRELLRATEEGLGSGEVPIFPIQIFKVKEGVNYCEADYELAMTDFDAALSGKVKFQTPNFDLLVEACRCNAEALFPNFLFLDTPFNKHEDWCIDDPKRYLHEPATMGCRTRVFENLRGEKSSLGRGNLSFTSLNMPRLAIEAKREAELNNPAADKHELAKYAAEIFIAKVKEVSVLMADQLYERYQYQRTALAKQYPFMMSNDVWKGGINLDREDEVGDVIASGTLGLGFIGGHNAMVAIYGEGHAHNKDAWQTLYDAIMAMNKVAQEYKDKYNLNYSVLATPAEGLSGRFTRMDRKKYGSIAGVTDKDYYVNSFHIDVAEPVGIANKIQLEAPFHAITLGGHITYVELDGAAKKNVGVIMKIVKKMKEENIGYGSINHPIDTCNKCGYKGIIYGKCPVCGSDSISRLRRITGYLTGSLDSWNSAKQAEERDRVKHR